MSFLIEMTACASAGYLGAAIFHFFAVPWIKQGAQGEPECDCPACSKSRVESAKTRPC